MHTTIIRLFGTNITIRYQPHENNYMEWRMIHEDQAASPKERELLDNLLRCHYGSWIKNQLREHYHWKTEEEARATPPDPPF